MQGTKPETSNTKLQRQYKTVRTVRTAKAVKKQQDNEMQGLEKAERKLL